jgi:hypothetical protein
VLLAVDLKGAAVGVDVLPHVVILGQVEQLADLCDRTKSEERRQIIKVRRARK